ncbi:hypothetical protein [Burkholderia cepacia]|uniref:hypothetical protein n=1 Tax=Burkholderia cepacia TaxID=292 RepID=UPI001F18F8EE|nr:hypothetical protein [Burkholderia cepacia]MCE4125774.1 hypothetical protein [Burkholderia cepacia]
MREREMFMAAYRAEFPETCSTFPDRFKRSHDSAQAYENGTVEIAWAMWQAALRTRPDRDVVIEECAKVCDGMADSWNVAAQSASDGRFDFMTDACDRCADEIRTLKSVQATEGGG